jgi:hypothetical protein
VGRIEKSRGSRSSFLLARMEERIVAQGNMRLQVGEQNVSIEPGGASWASTDCTHTEAGAPRPAFGLVFEIAPAAKAIVVARFEEGSDRIRANGPESLLVFTTSDRDDPRALLKSALARTRWAWIGVACGVALAIAHAFLA